LKLFVPFASRRLFCSNAAAYAYILESLKHYAGAARRGGQDARAGSGQRGHHHLLGGAMSINYGKRERSNGVLECWSDGALPNAGY